MFTTVPQWILQSGFATESPKPNKKHIYNTLMLLFFFISTELHAFEPYINMPTWFHDCYEQGWNLIPLYHRETLKSLIVSCCIEQKTTCHCKINLCNRNPGSPVRECREDFLIFFFFNAWWNTWHGLPEGIIYNKGSRRKSETLATTKGKKGGVCVEKQTLKWPFNQQQNTHHDTKPAMCPNPVLITELKDYYSMTRKLFKTSCIFFIS